MVNTITLWTNNNQGFVTAIFSFATILLSAISVTIALRAIRTPYKKKLKLKVFIGSKLVIGDTLGNEVLSHIKITAINYGNRVIQLTDLCLYCHPFRIQNPMQNIKIQSKIYPSDIVSVEYDSYESFLFPKIEINIDKFKGKKWYAYAVDTEGEVYKERFREFERIVEKFISEQGIVN